MTASNWQRWYREGTVSVVNGSKTVTGTGTYWSSASIKAGDVFSLDGVTDYEVSAVVDDTRLTLATNFTGTTQSGVQYHIHRAFSATTESEVAAQTAALVQDMARYIDTEHATIQGKSAYELAKLNGYVGTEEQWLNSLVGKSAYEIAVKGGYKGSESEWLESLIGAGQWQTLNNRTSMLAEAQANKLFSCAALHNLIPRGKWLGEYPTPEQYKAIREQTFDDMWLGDWWGPKNASFRAGYMIAGFNDSFVCCDGSDTNFGGAWRSSIGIDPETGTQRLPIGARIQTEDYGAPFILSGGTVRLLHYNSAGTAPSGIDWRDASIYYDEDDVNDDGSFVGYTGCHWFRVGRKDFLTEAISRFGNEHLYEWPDYVPLGYNSAGEPTSWGWRNMRCEWPTFREIYGRQWYLSGASSTKKGTYQPESPRLTVYGERQQIPIMKLGYPLTWGYGGTMLRDIWGKIHNDLCGCIIGHIYTDNGETSAGTRGNHILAQLLLGSQSEADDSIRTTTVASEEGA